MAHCNALWVFLLHEGYMQCCINLLQIKGVLIMPYNAAYTCSSLGFGTEDQWRADLQVNRPKCNKYSKHIGMVLGLGKGTGKELWSTWETIHYVTLWAVSSSAFYYLMFSVKFTSFCCRSSSRIRMSRASARAALFAASLASACTWEKTELI